MVVSLQPVGFGFSQVKEGNPKDLEKLKDAVNMPTPNRPANHKRGQAQSPAQKSKEKLIIDASNDSNLSSAISISISSGSEQEQPKKKPAKPRIRREEPLYPTYWTEAISHLTHTQFAISSRPGSQLGTTSSTTPLQRFLCTWGNSRQGNTSVCLPGRIVVGRHGKRCHNTLPAETPMAGQDQGLPHGL
jgi:xeroderma pigmentosum group C-complementing protein